MAIKKWQEAAIRRELGLKRIKDRPAVEMTLTSIVAFNTQALGNPEWVLNKLRERVNRQIDLKLEAITQILESQSRDEFEAKRKVEHGSAHGK